MQMRQQQGSCVCPQRIQIQFYHQNQKQLSFIGRRRRRRRPLHVNIALIPTTTTTSTYHRPLHPFRAATAVLAAALCSSQNNRVQCLSSSSSQEVDDNNNINNELDGDDYNIINKEEHDEEEDDGVVVAEVEKPRKNTRILRAQIGINADLLTIWNILTDFERLSDFIPALLVSQLLHKDDNNNSARLLQIGQQNLALGLKFNAKVIVDCYEGELQHLPLGRLKRDIEFNMIEGDFQVFKGKWSILQQQQQQQQQLNDENSGGCDPSVSKDFPTTLSYLVEVTPKPWLPVGLVEGRLCKEIKVNLKCIRKEAEKAVR